MTDVSPPPDLPTDVCWALLRSADLGRLAVVMTGRPEIFPVNYVADHGSLVFRTAEGTKLLALAMNREVAFEVDGHDPVTGQAWSVVVKGRSEEIRGLENLVAADDLPIHPLHAGPKNRFLRIVPDEITGRRFATVAPEHWATPLTGRARTPHE